MSVFDRTPLKRVADDLKYLWDCSITKKTRERRFREMFNGCEELCPKPPSKPMHCQYWFTTQEMREEYKKLSKEHCTNMHLRDLEFAKFVYDKFEESYCPRDHHDWCIYEKYEEILREGIKKLGRTLHALCHAPLELIQFRAVGLKLFEDEKILNDMEKSKIADEKSKSDLEKRGRIVLHNEQFLQHYFEIISLRDTISEEIKLQEKQTSTIVSMMGVFGSLLLSLWISYHSGAVQGTFLSHDLYSVGPLDLKIIHFFYVILLFVLSYFFIWYIWTSIRLNEAKDVMYICLGVDIDNPKTHIVCD